VEALSGDPADLLRDLAASMRADPGLPPGVIALESDGETVARTIRSARHVPLTREAQEDYRSFAESWPYVIRLSGQGEPVVCECCGTLVALTPEALTVSAGGEPPVSRRWKPGIWEPETGRRHTMRRCGWKRVNP
jgi:hypothetical protein